MVAQTIKTSKIIDRFLKEVSKTIFIKKVILFGSYAQKRTKKDSDIDLAIISDSFKGIDYFERLVILGKLAWQAKATVIEALGFTLGEYKEASKLDFLGEIKKKGITLFEQR